MKKRKRKEESLLPLSRHVHSARASSVRRQPAPSPAVPWPVARRIRAQPGAGRPVGAHFSLPRRGVTAPLFLRRPRYYLVDASLYAHWRGPWRRSLGMPSSVKLRRGGPPEPGFFPLEISPAVRLPAILPRSVSSPHLAAWLARPRGLCHRCFPMPFISRGALLDPDGRCDPPGELGGGVFLRSTG